jgi:endonuclease/exonuclease/phosphatase family metal-dependent hydrolase
VKRLAAALALGLAAAAQAEPGATEISVVTYNIHGLPSWLAGDDPPARIPQLLERAKSYDVALIQEDFAHHAVLVAHNPFRWLVRGNEAAASALEGAGLTILSRFESVASHRQAYELCSGYLFGAGDCFASKGFLKARLALPGGAELDVWNTHLDAGGGAADREVRRAQLDRLAAAIEAKSAGRALVVGGDLNLELTHEPDATLLEAFAARLGLAVAARTPDGGWRSQLDYLLVRSGEALRLEVVGGGKDETFVDADRQPLSDHPAIFTRLRAR